VYCERFVTKVLEDAAVNVVIKRRRAGALNTLVNTLGLCFGCTRRRDERS
jgi:hypothetical protein